MTAKPSRKKTSIALSESLLAIIHESARKQQRSASGEIEKILRDYYNFYEDVHFRR